MMSEIDITDNSNYSYDWDNEIVSFHVTKIQPDASPSDYDLLVVCINADSLHELALIVDKMPPVSGPVCLCISSRNRTVNSTCSFLSADDAAIIAEHLGIKSWIVIAKAGGISSVFKHFYECFKGKTVHIPENTNLIKRPSDDVFREFCRVFGPGIRSQVPGNETKVLDVLVKMWRQAPPQLKMKLKRNIRRYPFERSDELQIPIP